MIKKILKRNYIITTLWGYKKLISDRLNYILISDKKYADNMYLKKTGKTLNLENPKSYDEKLWFLKYNYKKELITKCTDKVLVRDYISDLGLGFLLNDIYGVFSNPKQIDFNKMPEKMFIKCNHRSGSNILWDKEKPFDIKLFNSKFNGLLKQNYFYSGREWNYKNIKPLIFCEKVLEPKSELGLVDYRFLCFEGKCKFIFVDIDTCDEKGGHFQGAKRNVYNRDFELLNIKFTRENFDPLLVKKPENLDEMIEYAEKISKPFLECRVDFYNIDKRIIFGEITFYHASGCNIIEPTNWSKVFGDCIDLSKLENGIY